MWFVSRLVFWGLGFGVLRLVCFWFFFEFLHGVGVWIFWVAIICFCLLVYVRSLDVWDGWFCWFWFFGGVCFGVIWGLCVPRQNPNEEVVGA